MTGNLKHFLRALLCGIAVLCPLAPACSAQQYSFSQATEGLGNPNVNSIAQDPLGYLWVGTENGLYRYDGRQFQKYGAASGLHAHTIRSVFVGPDGTLWVGATTGIYFQASDGKFNEVHAPLPYNQFSLRIGSSFTANAPDQVVVADRNGAFLLRHIEPGLWSAEPMHLDGATIWSVLYAPGGELWYGCDSDLCRLADGKTTHLGASLNLPQEQWLHLLLARDGHLWVRGLSHLGEVVPAESRFALHDLPGRSNAVPYVTLAQDAQGSIVATQGPDFGLWENGNWRMVTARNGLSHNDLSELFVDREGSIWIGTIGHGLRRWVGQGRWEGYTGADGLSNDIVWATLRDKAGKLWIGTESGLDYLPAGEQTAKPFAAPGIQTARAVSLAAGPDGSIWMGSAAGNLVRIDPVTLSATQWKVPEVYRVIGDQQRRIWIATGAGLYVVDSLSHDRTPQLVQDPAIAHPATRFTDLCIDHTNRLWAASDDGLFRLDAAGWRRIDPGLSGVNPYQLAADHEGNLWVTGSFPGVMRLRFIGDRVMESEHITRPPLISEQVVSLTVDSRGWLWLGQDDGLSVYDGRSWRSYTQDDGLIWNDTDANALAEDTDGSLWIGTSGGLSHLLKPEANPAGPPPPPILSLVAFGATSISNGARIPWSASPLEISIAALTFRDARHIRTRYRMLGLESEWVETADNSVRYARLAPGAYRFQAVTLDDTGGESSPVTEISFRIVPLWWQSEPLRLSLALLAAIAAVLLWRGRIHLLVGQKQQLEVAVQNRTEELEDEKLELVRAQEKMRHFAEHDDLTGLWNHRIILERLRQELDRAHRASSPLSVILVDLDHFKDVNDTFGHPAGDLVLQEIAAIFQRSVRSYDWVGRYGGEEFLLILPGTSFISARIRAEQFRSAVQTASIVDGDRTIHVTASFGVASGYAADFEAMIHTADAALYRAKNNGRNCVMATEIAQPQGRSPRRDGSDI